MIETSADYSFVRCRSQFGLPAYGMTTVRHLQDGEQVDLKRVITAREYSYAVRHRADSKRHNVKQQRICFLWQDQSFQIHIYKEPEAISGLAICHVQVAIFFCNLSIAECYYYCRLRRKIQKICKFLHFWKLRKNCMTATKIILHTRFP